MDEETKIRLSEGTLEEYFKYRFKMVDSRYGSKPYLSLFDDNILSKEQIHKIEQMTWADDEEMADLGGTLLHNAFSKQFKLWAKEYYSLRNESKWKKLKSTLKKK